MPDRDDSSPTPADPRQQRLAEALRANLRRRKAQARARDAEPAPERGTSEEKGEESEGDRVPG